MILINNINELEKTIKENELCLIKIGTSHCGPCKIVQRNIEDIEKYNTDVCFINVDAEEADDIVEKYNVRGVPVVLVIKNGEIVSRTVGIQNQADLENRLR